MITIGGTEVETLRLNTIKALTRMTDLLKTRGAIPYNSEKTPTCRNHLMWMCTTAITKLEEESEDFPIDKASRWLGFVHGVLAMLGDMDVMKERGATRPLFTKSP